MGRMIILRGIPGSGKTTYAKNQGWGKEIICSTDHYFERPGGYKFHPSDLGAAHQASQQKAFGLCRTGAPLVVIDNTHTRIWEMQSYLQIAKEHNYEVQVVRLMVNPEKAAERCIHGVSSDRVKAMDQRMEPFEGELLYHLG